MFRFSIRDLLWATLAVALGLGWWQHYRKEKGKEKGSGLGQASLLTGHVREVGVEKDKTMRPDPFSSQGTNARCGD